MERKKEEKTKFYIRTRTNKKQEETRGKHGEENT